MSVSRTKGIDLDDEAAQRLLAAYLPSKVLLGQVHPKELWKLNKVTKDYRTSDWDAIQKEYSFLSVLLEATGGRIPHKVFCSATGEFPKGVWGRLE